MNDENRCRWPRFGLRFTIRSLLILTTLVAAFFGGRASMRPVVEAERRRTNTALQRVEQYAAFDELIEELKRLRIAQTKAAQRVVIQNSGVLRSQFDPSKFSPIDRAEQYELIERQKRLEKAINESPY